MKNKYLTKMKLIFFLCLGFGPQSYSQVLQLTECNSAWIPGFGNTTTFTATIIGGPPGIIKFRLTSSNEKGICLNKGTRTHSDLHFNTPENIGTFQFFGVIDTCDYVGQHEHYYAAYTLGCVQQATITVISEDYGSFGEIWAVASWVPQCPGPNIYIFSEIRKIPMDNNGNYIADIWWGDATGGNTDPTWDEETLPNAASTSRGDGLTRYEEYRGFYVQGSHTRLSTSIKELFIYRENIAWGAEDAAFAADIHFITAAEMNFDPATANSDTVSSPPGLVNPEKNRRCVNFNSGYATAVDQHGLWLGVSGGDGRWGNWGLAKGTNVPGPPRTAGRIEVYHDNISNACGIAMSNPIFRYGDLPQRGDAWFFYNATGRRDEMIRNVIGHELGHRINIWHHGDNIFNVRHAPKSHTVLPKWIDVNSRPLTLRKGRNEGGNRLCVMRYNYGDIRQSVALSWNPVGAFWRSGDDDWSPTVPTCDFGFCNGPTGTALVCRQNIIINDAD